MAPWGVLLLFEVCAWSVGAEELSSQSVVEFEPFSHTSISSTEQFRSPNISTLVSSTSSSHLRHKRHSQYSYPQHDQRQAFNDLLRQRIYGNNIPQCPCVIRPGTDKCIAYDSRYQASSIEEAILSFPDVSADPRKLDDIIGGPIGPNSFACTTLECQTCAALMAERLRSVGLLSRDDRLSLPTPSYLNSRYCTRYRFANPPRSFSPIGVAPWYVQEAIRQGQIYAASGGRGIAASRPSQPTAQQLAGSAAASATAASRTPQQSQQVPQPSAAAQPQRSSQTFPSTQPQSQPQTVWQQHAPPVEQSISPVWNGREWVSSRPQFPNPNIGTATSALRAGQQIATTITGVVSSLVPTRPQGNPPTVPHPVQPPYYPPTSPTVQPVPPQPPHPQPFPFARPAVPYQPFLPQPPPNPMPPGPPPFPRGGPFVRPPNVVGSFLPRMPYGRSKRQTKGGNVLGNRFVISCVNRGEVETDESDLLNLCTACWTWRQLPDDYFPRLINELVCKGQDEDYCLSGWGSCQQRFRNVDVLRKEGGSWKPTTISTATCCDCKVRAGSEIHSLIIGKKR